MTDLYDAAVALVVAGLSIGVTMLWLRRLSRLHRQRMDQLLALREELHRDPLATLARHRQVLAKLGLRSLDWHGHWYGTSVAASLGEKIPPGTVTEGLDAAQRLSGQVLAQRFEYDDISLELRVGLKGLHGERRMFAVQAAEVLFAMVQGALAARQLALGAAVDQRARVGVFLQHDMRNLAQWVQLVAEDFGSAQDDATLLSRARRLRSNAALAANRAQRMAQALLNPTWQPSASAPLEPSTGSGFQTMLNLAEYLHQAAELHQVTIGLDDPATVMWDDQALATVLDNVFGNVSSLSRERMLPAHCRVTIDSGAETTLVRFETPQLPLEIPLEKVFEPWSSSGSANKGLGMYQARKQAEQAGGQLYAELLGSGIRVTLSIPCKKS
jgi:signal transduction histidine kinase